MVRAIIIVVAVLTLSLFSMSCTMLHDRHSGPSANNINTDVHVLNFAKHVLENWLLRVPSSVQYLTQGIVAIDKYDRYLVRIEYSAENHYGGESVDIIYMIVEVD